MPNHHALEIRRRLTICVTMTCLAALILLPFGQSLYHLFATPLLQQLSPNSTLIATSLLTPWMTILKLSLLVAFALTLPIWLYHLTAFIKPGLHASERRVLNFLWYSGGLFYVGVAFAYFGLFSWLFQWLLKGAPQTVKILPDMGQFFDLAIFLLLFFGLAFQIPLLFYGLLISKFISPKKLRQQRRYWIIGSFILAMLIAPDVFSQLLIALFLCGLFELGLWLGCRRLR